jgi:hypothetical protein
MGAVDAHKTAGPLCDFASKHKLFFYKGGRNEESFSLSFSHLLAATPVCSRLLLCAH